jgi:hypothetical protein
MQWNNSVPIKDGWYWIDADQIPLCIVEVKNGMVGLTPADRHEAIEELSVECLTHGFGACWVGPLTPPRPTVLNEKDTTEIDLGVDRTRLHQLLEQALPILRENKLVSLVMFARLLQLQFVEAYELMLELVRRGLIARRCKEGDVLHDVLMPGDWCASCGHARGAHFADRAGRYRHPFAPGWKCPRCGDVTTVSSAICANCGQGWHGLDTLPDDEGDVFRG